MLFDFSAYHPQILMFTLTQYSTQRSR